MAMDGRLSQRLGMTFQVYGAYLSPDDREDLIDIANEAGTFAKLPSWVRDMIVAAEKEPISIPDMSEISEGLVSTAPPQ
jgi:hypothetical protein